MPRTLRAQQAAPWSGFGIEANLMGGKVLKHTEKFKLPVPDFSGCFELNFIQQTYGRKQWHQRRHYPLLGLGVAYTDYGLDSAYGKCIAVYPNLQFNIIRGRKLEWTFRVGFGGGYVTRHYSRAPEWDTLNNAIGSALNNFTLFSTDLRYRINDHLDVQAGFNFSHISDAAFRQPNLGINMYGAHVGLRYFPVAAQPQRIQYRLKPLSNRWLGQLRLGIAMNEAGPADGPLYPTWLASAFVSRRYASRNKMFAGIDYSYHKRVEAFLKNNEIFPGEEKQHSWKSSIFIGNEFLLGRVSVVLQVGYYLKDTYLRLDPYYQKLGGNLYLVQKEKGPLKELCFFGFLKTHKAQAEMMEMGLGAGF